MTYNPDDRCGTCPDRDACSVLEVEIGFAIEVAITQAQQRALQEIVTEIAQAPYNQPKEGVHWASFVGGKLNYSARDAELLGRPVGESPPPDGAEPDSDDSVLVFETSAREFVNGHEREKVQAERAIADEQTHFTHVDEFIDDYRADAYARWVLMHFRLPAHGHAFEKFMAGNRLFCTYEGKRYRVTVASRLGDIGIHSDFAKDHGYTERVSVDQCSAWGAEP